jgi:hypothetical protein
VSQEGQSTESKLAVLQHRIVSNEARIKVLEGTDKDDRSRESDRYALILERLARLETRVAVIAGLTGLASTIIVLFVKGLFS